LDMLEDWLIFRLVLHNDFLPLEVSVGH
jgi:hypothetical protein